MWAPEVQWINDSWYIYYSASNKDDLGTQRIHVLKGKNVPNGVVRQQGANYQHRWDQHLRQVYLCWPALQRVEHRRYCPSLPRQELLRLLLSTHRPSIPMYCPHELTYFSRNCKDTVATHLVMGEDWRVSRQRRASCALPWRKDILDLLCELLLDQLLPTWSFDI